MAGKKPPKTTTRFRSAVDGQFEKPSVAKANPREHIKQRIPVGKPSGRKK